jgi:hypothetical protein
LGRCLDLAALTCVKSLPARRTGGRATCIGVAAVAPACHHKQVPRASPSLRGKKPSINRQLAGEERRDPIEEANLRRPAFPQPCSARRRPSSRDHRNRDQVRQYHAVFGTASALSVTGKAFAAYFDSVNEKGGVNGRKLNMISLDDGFSPPKTVEATRRLVESDGVAFMFGTMGTAPSSATAKYLNGAKVPHCS